jgi:hypothetical protein
VLEFDVMWGKRLSGFANIFERVAEDISIRTGNLVLFPIKFPIIVPFGKRMKREVHRPHIHGGHSQG